MATWVNYRTIYHYPGGEGSGSKDFETYDDALECWNEHANTGKCTSLELQKIITETVQDWYKKI